MRKLILIAAMSLIATQACAGGTRSLSLAASDATAHATAPATAQPTVTATATASTTTPPAQQVRPAVTTTADLADKTRNRPKHRQPSVEARVIHELHRHGIYW